MFRDCLQNIFQFEMVREAGIREKEDQLTGCRFRSVSEGVQKTNLIRTRQTECEFKFLKFTHP